jgi:hypothetical protein
MITVGEVEYWARRDEKPIAFIKGNVSKVAPVKRPRIVVLDFLCYGVAKRKHRLVITYLKQTLNLQVNKVRFHRSTQITGRWVLSSLHIFIKRNCTNRREVANVVNNKELTCDDNLLLSLLEDKTGAVSPARKESQVARLGSDTSKIFLKNRPNPKQSECLNDTGYADRVRCIARPTDRSVKF